jgi:hypothetical protein
VQLLGDKATTDLSKLVIAFDITGLVILIIGVLYNIISFVYGLILRRR